MNIYSWLLLLLLCSCNLRNKHGAQLARQDEDDSLAYCNLPYVTDFEKFALETMAETHQPGAAVAIVKDNKVVFLKGFGVRAAGTNDSIDIHTVFRIASVSKGVASTLAGILVQEKALNWDDKVINYIPDFILKDTFSTNHITIRNVLSHTCGLPRHTFTNMIEGRVPYEKLKASLRNVPAVAKPGVEFAYQNVVYSLIGDVIEQATQKPFREVIKEKLFTPLQMNDASVSFETLEHGTNVALPHYRRRDSMFFTIRNTPEYYSVLPAAGVNASISDMSKLLLALLGNNPQILSPETLNELYKPEIQIPRKRKYRFLEWQPLKATYYAKGWRVLDFGGNTVIYHGGFLNGYRSEIAFCPSEKIGIVVLCNASGKLANESVPVFLNTYFGNQHQIKKAELSPLANDNFENAMH